MILWCWTTQVPVRQTVSLTRLSEVTVRHWFEQFRIHLPDDQDVLEHLVQLDEAYFGGKSGHTLMMAKQIDKKERKLASVITGCNCLYRTCNLLLYKHRFLIFQCLAQVFVESHILRAR